MIGRWTDVAEPLGMDRRLVRAGLLVAGRLLGLFELFAPRHRRPASWSSAAVVVVRPRPTRDSPCSASCTRRACTPARPAGSSWRSATPAPRPHRRAHPARSGHRHRRRRASRSARSSRASELAAAYRLPTERRGHRQAGPAARSWSPTRSGWPSDHSTVADVARAHRAPPDRPLTPAAPHRRPRRPARRRRPPERARPERRGLLRAARSTSSATTCAGCTGRRPPGAASSWCARTSCRGRAGPPCCSTAPARHTRPSRSSSRCRPRPASSPRRPEHRDLVRLCSPTAPTPASRTATPRSTRDGAVRRRATAAGTAASADPRTCWSGRRAVRSSPSWPHPPTTTSMRCSGSAAASAWSRSSCSSGRRGISRRPADDPTPPWPAAPGSACCGSRTRAFADAWNQAMTRPGSRRSRPASEPSR